MRERMLRSRMCSCQSMPVLNRLQESGEAGLLRAAGAADRRAALKAVPVRPARVRARRSEQASEQA